MPPFSRLDILLPIKGRADFADVIADCFLAYFIIDVFRALHGADFRCHYFMRHYYYHFR